MKTAYELARELIGGMADIDRNLEMKLKSTNAS